MPPTQTSRPTRRALLRGAVGGAGVGLVLGVGGCGLRLESDAPHVPFVPRQPYPGLALLAAERERLRAAHAAADTLARAGAARPVSPAAWRAIAQGHAADLDALQARLDAIGEDVPGPSPTLSGASPAGATAPAAAHPSATPDEAGATNAAGQAEAADLAAGIVTPALASAATAPAADLPVLVRGRVGRAHAARLLGREIPGSPERPMLPVPVAARVLDLVRPVVYGLEVAAAQAAPARREVARDCVTVWAAARDRLDELAAPGSPPPFAYRLPFPVTTPAAAERLAAQLLTSWSTDLADACAAVAGDLPGLTALSGWALDALTWRDRWGGGPAVA